MGNLKTILSLLLLLLTMMVHFILLVLADGTTPKQIMGKRFLRVENGDTVMQCKGPGPACPQLPLSGAHAVLPLLSALEGPDPAGSISQALSVGFQLTLAIGRHCREVGG